MHKHTLFIDESGKSSLAEKADEPFILTGVILKEEDINTVEGFFNYIKRKYQIDSSTPFHSYDLFENSKLKMTDIKAKKLLNTIAEFISLIPIKVSVFSIGKSIFKSSLGVKTENDLKGTANKRAMREFPYRIMSSRLFAWFAEYLNISDSIGQIIVDARVGGDQQLLRTLNTCKDPNGPIDKNISKLIKEKCNAICFAEKYFFSGGLEITDLISYTSFFHARKKMNSMSSIGLQTVWKEIRKNLSDNSLKKLGKRDIKKFFGVGRDGVHPYLKEKP